MRLATGHAKHLPSDTVSLRVTFSR